MPVTAVAARPHVLVDPSVQAVRSSTNRRLDRKLQLAETIIADRKKKLLNDPGDPPETTRHRRVRLMLAIEADYGYGRDVGVVSEHRHVPRVALSAAMNYAAGDAPAATTRHCRSALVAAERRAVRDTLHSARFVDQSPDEVLCERCSRSRPASARLRARRTGCSPMPTKCGSAVDQVRHPACVISRARRDGAESGLVLGRVTKLKGQVPYLYDALWVMHDLFSRYVVGWIPEQSTRARTWSSA